MPEDNRVEYLKAVAEKDATYVEGQAKYFGKYKVGYLLSCHK